MPELPRWRCPDCGRWNTVLALACIDCGEGRRPHDADWRRQDCDIVQSLVETGHSRNAAAHLINLAKARNIADALYVTCLVTECMTVEHRQSLLQELTRRGDF